MPDVTEAAAISAVADRLLAADTAQHLISILDDELARVACGPGKLYLYDSSGGVFYPVAGFGCDKEGPDLAESSLPPGSIRLDSGGQPVGALVLALPTTSTLITCIAGMLGPLLVQLHRRQLVVEELRETREIVAQLAVAGDLLRHLDLDVLLTKLLETALHAMSAQVGAVLLPGASGKLDVKVSWGLEARHLDAIQVRGDGRSVAEYVFATGIPVMAPQSKLHQVLDLGGLDARLDGLLALALAARDRILGVLVLANPTQEFGSAKRRLADTLCNLAGTAIDNALLVKDQIERERLRQEIDLARSVQEKMFPTEGMTVADMRIEGWSRPCSETGGDYYTFVPRGSGLVAMVGDVSGHGLGAALFTTMAHALAQQQFRAGADLAAAFRQLNEGLYFTRSGRFMTAAAVAIDQESGRFEYVSAGHTPTLWINRGQVRWLDSTAMPLGIVPSLEIDPTPPRILEPGDLLVMYTDGITEASHDDGDTLGDDRFADTVLAAWRSRLPPRRVLDLIAAAVDGFTAGRAQADDLTAVVVARAGDGTVDGWQLVRPA